MIDYKKIIKSREVRLRLLKCLSFIPDKTMLKIQYKIKTGRKLNLKNPERYTEKIQWYKLYYKNPLMIQCVDKYDVREYITKKGYETLLNGCIGVYENIDDIDFNSLPDQFVIKDTLGTGGNEVIICKNKDELDIENVKAKLSKWLLEENFKSGGREWPYYSGKQHRIIIEDYIPSGPYGLVDYKFMCFSGKVDCVYVLTNRNLGISVNEAICDSQLQLLPYSEVGDDIPDIIPVPDNYDEMVKIVEDIAKDFPHVRVDLYNVDGRIIFGELTFYDSSGYARYSPDEFDYLLGKNFKLIKQ